MRSTGNSARKLVGLKKILVFRIGHLGDTIVALPAFWALRDAFPNANISLLSNYDPDNPDYVTGRNVLPDNGLFDGWLTYPSSIGSMRTLYARLKLLAKIRREKFDAVVYLMTRNRTPRQIARDVRFFRLAGINSIFGVDNLKRNLFVSPIPVPTPEVTSEADFLIECLEADGVPVTNRTHDLALTDTEKSFAEKWLSNNVDENFGPRVAVAPGSKWESKVWSEERFAAVISKLIDRFGIYPIVFGDAGDREAGNRLLRKWGTGVNAAGELTVRQSAALLERCDLYVGNDTGVMHLAGAVGTPCVAIFAAVDWIGRWKPFGESNRFFRK